MLMFTKLYLITYILDVRQADRAQSVETLLSPLAHVPLSAKSSTSVINSIATINSGNFYC